MGLNLDELSTMGATAQADLVRRRELTQLKLLDAAIARIERVNPRINTVITPLFEEARKAAGAPDCDYWTIFGRVEVADSCLRANEGRVR
jgi:amidase